MLTRLKLTAIRDQLDTLLDQAGRAELNLREALAMLCAAEVARCVAQQNAEREETNRCSGIARQVSPEGKPRALRRFDMHVLDFLSVPKRSVLM
jgi:hypothetical protein